jgi:hypothetical protein
VKTIKGGLEFDEKIHLPHKKPSFPLAKRGKIPDRAVFSKNCHCQSMDYFM